MGLFNSTSLKERSLVGEVVWQAPSNLALIKYWGKKGQQLPANPSLSMTLRQSVTTLEAQFSLMPDSHQAVSDLWEFQFQGESSNTFDKKIFAHLETMASYYPFLLRTKLNLRSRNSFPHSAGIASSASASMSTALLVEGLASLLRGQKIEKSDPMFLRRASFLARLGSGSAARSAFPTGALWGKATNHDSSSDEWAVGVESDLPYLKNLEDMILVVDESKKKVSSREGHALMNQHPYRDARYAQARERLEDLWHLISKASRSEDFHLFGPIIEAEAMDLHSLMMSSVPPVVLMAPATLAIILALWEWRKSSNVPAYFTLDAGPNLHLLYPKAVEPAVQEFKKIISEKNLLPSQIIYDGVGSGPQLLRLDLKA